MKIEKYELECYEEMRFFSLCQLVIGSDQFFLFRYLRTTAANTLQKIEIGEREKDRKRKKIFLLFEHDR